MVKSIDISDYDHIIVALSGGKDSVACLLHLIELGVPKNKIEAWHHLVDGRERELFFDFPVTEDYCRKLCAELNVKLYFSWRSGGLEAEMLRFEESTAATYFETPQGLQTSGGDSNKLNTRYRFPQIGGTMKTRWCSSYAKIGVGNAAIARQTRFKGKKILFVSGERKEESAQRSKYKKFQPHSTSIQSRQVDHLRLVLEWDEAQVWSMLKKFKIRPHPAYELGFGRCSCIICIFASDDQLATVYQFAPHIIHKMADYEKAFDQFWRNEGVETGYKIHRQYTVMERIARGNPYPLQPAIAKLAMSTTYYEKIIVDTWELPIGAFNQDKSGPT